MLTWQAKLYTRGNAQRTYNFVLHTFYRVSSHRLYDGSGNLAAMRMSASRNGRLGLRHPHGIPPNAVSRSTILRYFGQNIRAPSRISASWCALVVKVDDTMQCYRNLKPDQTHNHPALAEQLPRPKPTGLCSCGKEWEISRHLL
jgi:hypothetical protein